MKKFFCRCGHRVFFDNLSCVNCGRQLAFDWQQLDMRSEQDAGAGLPFCLKRMSASRCNWTSDSASSDGSCRSCRMSHVIPSLSKPENKLRWRRLEVAKRRLFYDLLRLGLPVDPARMSFVFKEDRRTNPDVHETHVATGHADGVITINAAEADDVFREKQRQIMNEAVRTLLGHFRHESGHYYYQELVDDRNVDEARALFGDETADYGAALQHYYDDGPPADWRTTYVSGYASAHPAEDWAECWAHFLHIEAVLETAQANGLIESGRSAHWERDFIELMMIINEILRSLGQPDAYPFVLTAAIIDKIRFIGRTISRRRV